MRIRALEIWLLVFPLGLMLSVAAALPQEGILFAASTATLPVLATPTLDRLAEPTLPAIPAQPDNGAQVYWGYCLPCHGDKGQGLTAEFRKTYPPEEEYCWQSGCHGARPYENGFTLPPTVPAVIGPAALRKFPTAANLHGYISAAMPFWKPGILTEEQSWQVTAFLLRDNGLWGGGEVGPANADLIRVGPPQATPPPTPSPAPSLPGSWVIAGGAALALALVTLHILRRSRPRS